MAKELSILEETIKELNKKSKNSVYLLDENKGIEIKRYSTGRLSLDIPLGGGIPEGRIVEIVGQESSGKTTHTLHTIASYQKQGFKCAFIDYEHAFDPTYARALGVNTKELIFSQPTTAEEGLDIVDALVGTGELKLVVVDSVAAMVPKKELMGDSGDSSIGVHARLMSQAMRKLAGRANTTKTNIIFINQYREKIGVMMGDPRVTTGGNALKFFASIRIDVSQGKKDVEKGFNRGKLRVIKNKTFAPFRTSEYDMEYGKGVSKETELIDYAVEAGIIDKAGSWYSYDGTNIGQGKDAVKELLADNVELEEEIRGLVLSVYLPTEEEKEIIKS